MTEGANDSGTVVQRHSGPGGQGGAVGPILTYE